MRPKTVLIGLDGATFSILDPLMERGVMPFLRDFVATGIRAPLRSVMPPLTPPAWTSLMTGKRPGHHGVFDFFQKEAPDSRYFRFTGSRDIEAETIWSLASDRGRTVTALNFPLMFPPSPINGCIVPGGWMPWKQLRLGCHPAGLFDRLKALPTFNARELAFDIALEEKTLEGCAADEYADWITLHTRREQRWSEVTRFLMEQEPADLTAVLFDGVDKLQHLCWRFLDPAFRSATPSEWERRMIELCEDYFRQLDGIIAGIVGQAGPEATVLMASDHGFGPSYDVFFVNTWLAQQGYLAWSDGQSAPSVQSGLQVGIGQISRHVFELDWERTIAYAATPSSQGIHIVRRSADSPAGVPPESYDAVRRRLVDDLLRLRHPITGRPVVTEAVLRDEAFSGPFESLAPDITMLLEDNGVISILRSDEPLKRRPEPTGTHHPVGVFLGRGPGLRSGAVGPELSLVDVAPLVLYCLGIPIPDDLDGKLPESVFDPAVLEQRPPLLVSAHRPADFDTEDDAEDNEPAYDADEEETVLKRLRALGYIE